MNKRVYISADYSENDGDREVVDVLKQWGSDNKHITNFVDTAEVKSGSISRDQDCRPCDLKKEFNKQINASSAVIFVVGDKTKIRTAGSSCSRLKNDQAQCSCTPYKQNTKGTTSCKVFFTSPASDDFGEINACSYLKHEFMQAIKRGKVIVIVYNSLNKQPHWLPDYMVGYETIAQPFWIQNKWGDKIGNYPLIKKALGYE
jgi:hypothetical protein